VNNIEVELQSTEIARTTSLSSRVNVYGNEIILDFNKSTWNITTDLESGQLETVDTLYYMYVTQDGERVLSETRPSKRDDLMGFYHPQETWRCVGMTYNNSSNDLDLIDELKYNPNITSKTMIFKDVKSAVAGGTFNSGAWQVRDMNTAVSFGNSFGKVDSNQLHLIDGIYSVHAVATAKDVNTHAVRIEAVAAAVVIMQGANVASNATGGSMASAEVKGEAIVTDKLILELQHRSTASRALDGFGEYVSAFGTSPIFSEIEFIKIG